MAHVLRLILAVLLLWATAAQAVVPTETQYRVRVGATGETYGPWASSKVAACQGVLPLVQAAFGASYTVTYVGVTSWCVLHYAPASNPSGQPQEDFSRDIVSQQACPANSTLSGGSCACNSGYQENSAGTACELPPDPCKAIKGTSAGDWWKDTGDDDGKPARMSFYVCDRYNSVGGGLCSVLVSKPTCVQTAGGWWRCTGEGYYTGSSASDAAKCNMETGGSGEDAQNPLPATPPVIGTDPPKAPAEPAPNSAAPAPCGAGMAPGEVNGISKCYPTGGDGTPTVSEAPGNGTNTTKNADGSSTTTSQTGSTTCTAGTCTTSTSTTTTTTNSSGTVTGTSTSGSTSSTSKDDFCAKNPTSTQCGDEDGKSSFNGNCTSGFTAKSEDAVLNAMAEEQYRRNCAFFEKVPAATAESQAYDEMKAKYGTDQTGDLPADSQRTMSLSPSDIDSSNALGVAQCLSDKTITVMDRSIVLPLSNLCPWFAYLGSILMICAYLVAGRIVMKG